MERKTEKLKEKPIVPSELAYLLGVAFLSLGVTLTGRAGWGCSVGVVLAYVLNVRFPFFTLGVWSYIVQAGVLLIMVYLLKKFDVRFLWCFLSAVVYGYSIDLFDWLFRDVHTQTLIGSAIMYVAGFLSIGLGIAFYILCGLPPLIYDLFVKEITEHYKTTMGRIKTILDVSIVVLAIITGLVFCGYLVGVGVATVITAIFVGRYMQWVKNFLEGTFDFRPLITVKKPKPLLGNNQVCTEKAGEAKCPEEIEV